MGGRQWVAFNIHLRNASITQYIQAHYVSSHYRPWLSMQSGRVLTLQKENKNVRQPGIEPGSIAWKATMLTFTPPTLLTVEAIENKLFYNTRNSNLKSLSSWFC